jgi:hypothetical protein
MTSITQRNAMTKTQAFSDKFAMILSSLCVVHCLLTPLLLIAIPSLAGVALLTDESFHHLLLYFVVPVGFVALLVGFMHHRTLWVVCFGLTGLMVLSSPLVLEMLGLGHEVLGENGEAVVTVIGSLFVVAAHIANLRLSERGTPQEASVTSV